MPINLYRDIVQALMNQLTVSDLFKATQDSKKKKYIYSSVGKLVLFRGTLLSFFHVNLTSLTPFVNLSCVIMHLMFMVSVT